MIIPYFPAKGRAELIPTQCGVVPGDRKITGSASLSSELRGKNWLQAAIMEVGSKALLRSARLPGIKGPALPGNSRAEEQRVISFQRGTDKYILLKNKLVNRQVRVGILPVHVLVPGVM